MRLLFLLLLLAASFPSQAQFWYDDAHGDNFPVLRNNSKTLFSGRIKPADGSLSASLFNKWGESITSKTASDGLLCDNIHYWGWGTSLKAKVEDGVGTLLASGKATPSGTLGGYLSRQWWICKEKNDNGTVQKVNVFKMLIAGARYTRSGYRFLDPSKPFSNQLSDLVGFDAPEGFLGAYWLLPAGKNFESNVILGTSLKYQKKSSYSTLAKVEVKTLRQFTNLGKDTLRTATGIDDDGYTYAVDSARISYKTYGNFQVQGHIGLVLTGGRAAIQLYPSVDFNQKQAKFNVGLGLYLLKEGEPTLTVAGLYFELNDVFKKSTDPFFSRTFTIGLVAELNILSREAR